MTGRFFIYDPQDKLFLYDDRLSWEKAMSDFDFLGKYCDDGWDEHVLNVVAGILPSGVLSYDEGYYNNMPDDLYMDEDEFYESYATHQVKEYLIEEIDEKGYGVETKEYRCNPGYFDRIVGYSFSEKING